MSRIAHVVSAAALIAASTPGSLLAQQVELSPGTSRSVEVVAVYLGATSCGPCLQEETKQVIRDVLDAVSQRASERNLKFQSVGAALDQDVKAGLDLLESTADFDQVISGGNWSNAAAVEFIWSDPEVLAAIPQLVILTRAIDRRVEEREPASRHIFVHLHGQKQMKEWLAAGATIF